MTEARETMVTRGKLVRLSASVYDLPDATARVVRDVERAVGTLCEPGRPVIAGHPIRIRAGEVGWETLGEHLVRSRGLPVLERLKHHVVATRRLRRAIPRTVERDERAVAIPRGERRSRVEEQRVRRPVPRKECDIACL